MRAYATGAAALLVSLSACGGGQVTPRSGDDTRTAPAVREAPDSTAHVLERRRAAGIADCPSADPSVPAVTDGLPDLTLDCLGEDSTVRLAGLRGTPLVINVWAQWCGPCRQEAPYLAEGSARLGEEVRFLGIDYVDPYPERAVAFAQQAGWHYPQLVDPDRASAPDLGIVGPPLTLLVDADGRIVHRHPGAYASTGQLLDQVSTHLGVTP